MQVHCCIRTVHHIQYALLYYIYYTPKFIGNKPKQQQQKSNSNKLLKRNLIIHLFGALPRIRKKKRTNETNERTHGHCGLRRKYQKKRRWKKINKKTNERE